MTKTLILTLAAFNRLLTISFFFFFFWYPWVSKPANMTNLTPSFQTLNLFHWPQWPLHYTNPWTHHVKPCYIWSILTLSCQQLPLPASYISIILYNLKNVEIMKWVNLSHLLLPVLLSSENPPRLSWYDHFTSLSRPAWYPRTFPCPNLFGKAYTQKRLNAFFWELSREAFSISLLLNESSVPYLEETNKNSSEESHSPPSISKLVLHIKQRYRIANQLVFSLLIC